MAAPSISEAVGAALVPVRRSGPGAPRLTRAIVRQARRGCAKGCAADEEPLSAAAHEPFIAHWRAGPPSRARGARETVTGASLRPLRHDRIRSDPMRLQIGLVGPRVDAARLFTEEERNERAFLASDALPRRARTSTLPTRGARALPSIRSCSRSSSSCCGCPGSCRTSGSCVECGAEQGLVAFDPAAGVARSARRATTARSRSRRRGSSGSRRSSARRSPTRRRLGLGDRCFARRARGVLTSFVRAPRRLPPPDARLIRRGGGFAVLRSSASCGRGSPDPVEGVAAAKPTPSGCCPARQG
jgi:hypothetical protein